MRTRNFPKKHSILPPDMRPTFLRKIFPTHEMDDVLSKVQSSEHSV